MPIKNPLVRNDRLEQLQSADSIDISSISYSGKRHYVGLSPYPFTPVKGDKWSEFDSFNNFIEEWIWNGNYWLTKQIFYHSLTTLSAFSATASIADFPVDPITNIFVTNLIANFQINSNSTSTNAWTWTLSRNNATNTPTTLGSITTAGVAANTWTVVKAAINLHINVAATVTRGMRIAESRVGNLTKMGTAMVEYKKAKIIIIPP